MKTSTFFLSALSLFVPLVLLPLVEAHGIVSQVVIDGKSYQGPIAGGKTIPGSPVRQISSASPVKGATNKAMTCGPNAKPAPFVAPANPGSTVNVLWAANDRQHWPHNTGPMEVYLASCGSSTCDKFDAANAQWFKINEVGKRSGGGWVQQDQFDGKAHSFKLPSTLASGGYLLRHEILGLHLANQAGGAEFYPSCIQIDVGGSQTGAPSPNELVRFPGAYKDTDPGILVNAFGNAAYKFPGPAISKLASTSSTNPAPDSPSPSPSGTEEDDTPVKPTPTKSTPAKPSQSADTPAKPSPSADPSEDDDTRTPAPSGTDEDNTPAKPSPSADPSENDTGACNPKKKRAAHDDSIPSVPAPLDEYKPRHVSRVMARIIKPHSH